MDLGRTYDFLSLMRLFNPAVGMLGKAGFLAGMDWIIGLPGPASKMSTVVVLKSLLDFLHRVHHKGPILGYRLTYGTALKQKQLPFTVAVLQ